MSDHFIGLNCSNCGATLDVYDDMERFICGACGTNLLVQRRGGTVRLTSVTEAIRKVQVGTDKTAAELALIRLNDELKVVGDRASAQSKAEQPELAQILSMILCFFGIILVVMAMFVGSMGMGVVGLLMFIFFGYVFIQLAQTRPSPALTAIEEELTELKARIEDQRRIVNS